MNNKWNLKLIYETEEDFTNDLNKCLDYVSKIEGLKGKLNNNVDIKKYFSLNKELDQLLSKVFSYASQSHHLNQKEVSAAKRYQLVYQKYLEAVSRLSFVEPELLQNKYEDLMALCDSDSDVANSRFMIQKLFKRQSHVLDVKTEGVMALYNDATTGYQNLYSALCEQDSTPKKVTLTSGKEVEVSHATYTSLLQSLESQEDRRIVFEALYSYYDTHKHTLSGIYKGIMAGENAERINRGYNTTLDMFLDQNDISKDVFMSLIDVASNDNEAIKRYYNLRKNYFKLDNLYTYDRFLQFRKIDINFTYEKQKELVLEADKELGSDYYNKACKVLEDGRVDVEPCDGKYNGAYSTHIYDKGTFILLNNTNNLESAFTLAHEAGHSIHSMYSIESQPYETHDYVIFVAEVASTFNEARFLDYMLSITKSKDEKIVLLQKAIDNLIATFHASLIVAGTAIDGGTPEVDIGQDSVDTVLIQIALVAPVTIGRARDSISRCFLQVVDTHCEHLVGSCLRGIEVITAIQVCPRRHRNIVEHLHQIEIAEGAQSQYLCFVGIIVASRIVGVNCNHTLSLLQYEVTVING